MCSAGAPRRARRRPAIVGSEEARGGAPRHAPRCARLYGEFLLDDAHAKSADYPNKYAWQLGLDGAWMRGFTRLTWNTEYTWISRYVYTSYYGRDYVAQALPIGYPTGPDSSRLHVRVTWDPRVAWQCIGLASRTWKGENDLDEPFVPGMPVPPWVNSRAWPR